VTWPRRCLWGLFTASRHPCQGGESGRDGFCQASSPITRRLDMLGVFAEFETNLRRERQLEGIAKAKAVGVYKGRPPSIEASRVREMKAQGMRTPRP
jgi:DNA invertase Pin-like site-specific DNA recombinase